MTRRILVLLAAIIASLAFTGSAQADRWEASQMPRGPLAASLQIAASFWDAWPSDCRAITISSAPLTGEVGTILTTPRCEIRISRSIVQRHTFGSKIQACSIAVHEFGHLLGHDHSENSDSIMWPEERSTVRACYEHFIGHGARRDRLLHGDRGWATR